MTDVLEVLTDDDLSGLLEDDYRRQLRWYPRPWRAAHGDALIGTLLDEADDTDRITMQRGEWRSFAAAGLTARLDRVIMRGVRDAAATVMLSMGAGASLVTFVISSWAPWGTGTADLSAAFGPFSDAGPVLTALWGIALIAALADRWWIGRIALLLSVLVAIFMRSVEAQIAPPHFFSLDPGTLALSATSAFLAVLGTPRTRLPLLAASAGWAGLTCIGHAYQLLAGGGPADGPAGVLLGDPARTSWAIALTLGVAVIFAIARFWVPAFTILLSVVPATAALEAFNIVAGAGNPPGSYLPIVAPVTAGLVLLVLASRGGLRIRNGICDGFAARPVEPLRRRRRSTAAAVAILAPALLLGGTASILTASGLNWTRPTAVNWTEYWRISTTRAWTGWAQHPDASLSYRLPSGGTCTIRVGVPGDYAGTPSRSAAKIARDYLAAESTKGTLLEDAHVDEVITKIRSQQNTATNFWGVPMRYGYGTENDNPDVEYFEAVDAAIRQAVHNHVEQAGASGDDIVDASMQQCSGEQQ